MKNTIRCCISCILPCGALDVVRIVHSNGRVDEITGSVRAADVMKANPKHVLKKPSSDHDGVPKIVVVPPDAELQRGKIYFLMPAPSPPPKSNKSKKRSSNHNNTPDQTTTTTTTTTATRRRSSSNSSTATTTRQHARGLSLSSVVTAADNINHNVSLLLSDQYLTEILSEKHSTRRRGRAAVWRPHLESISESPNHHA